MRQDPNVILIGEMRDEETAQIAVRAAITGHLVLSTIHTNNALATLERLFDMGVERYMAATSVVGIISQRLARTLCDKCKKLRPTTKYERYMFARVLHKKVKEIYEPVGCDDCHHGYTGRIAIHEVLYISEHLRDLIADDDVEKDQLRDEVYGNSGTTTLLQDALQKVINGNTTFQEIYRVVDIDVDLDNAIKAEVGIKDEEDVVDVVEDADWNTFDGTFDDELELIDVEQVGEDDLPTFDTSFINFDNFEREFNKKLSPSDPLFVKFFILEDKKILEEDLEFERLRQLAAEEERERLRQEAEEEEKKMEIIDAFEANNSLISEFGLTEEEVRSEQTVIEDNQNLVELDVSNNTIDNVIGGFNNDSFIRNNILDLTNVEFNYKEILDLIDIYSEGGPTIEDVVELNERERNENQA